MSRCTEFLTNLGFRETIDNDFPLEDIDDDVIELYADLFEKNISILRDELDDEFIVEMFVYYNSVFMRVDFSEIIGRIKKEFDTDMWGTMIQYEWNETGESSVFYLLDALSIGYFDSHLSEVCSKVRSTWVNDYGDAEL